MHGKLHIARLHLARILSRTLYGDVHDGEHIVRCILNTFWACKSFWNRLPTAILSELLAYYLFLCRPFVLDVASESFFDSQPFLVDAFLIRSGALTRTLSCAPSCFFCKFSLDQHFLISTFSVSRDIWSDSIFCEQTLSQRFVPYFSICIRDYMFAFVLAS